jgi:hypothetical protein
MYRGFQTYRHFLNAKLHALSAIICGDDGILDDNLEARGKKSVTELDLKEAEELYGLFARIAQGSMETVDEWKSAIGQGKMTEKQRAMIIKICRYKFHWPVQATFSFIAEMFPAYRKRLSLWEIENSKLAKLYAMLSAEDADRIIKRLLQIEKRNAEKETK